MRIIILGPPGTGKGTQAKKLSRYLNLKIISSGDIIREEVKNNTEFGVMAKFYMDKGEFVPDEDITEVIINYIKKYDKGYILDGYPRNINQVNGIEVDKVIHIKSSKENILTRLKGRLRLRKRSDDKIEIIEKRFGIYEKETKPLLEYYKDKLIEINGDQSIEGVFSEIIRKLK